MRKELFQNFMLHYLNIPYVYGGKNPLVGEDCSGLVCEFLQARGRLKTNEELSSQQLFDRFKNDGRGNDRETGSLAFYGKSISEISHVAMFFDEICVIEAGHGTSDTTTKEKAAERGAISRMRPYDYRVDLVAILKIELGLISN